MHDDQIDGLLRSLEGGHEADPAFADALFDRLTLVARTQRRSRLPMLLLAAALLVVLAASIALGSGLVRLPVVVDLPATPTPSASTSAAATPSAAASPSQTSDASPSAVPSEPVADLAGRTLYAAADGLRLRAEPGEDAEVVTTLRAGQLMGATGQVVSEDGARWYEVAIGFRGMAGWLSSGPQGDWVRVVEDGAIAFRCDGCGTEHTLVAVTPFGDASLEAVAGGVGMNDVAWSPDGRRLAGTVDDGPDHPSVIAVIDADGSGFVRLGDGYAPHWSPDGGHLAWSTGPDVMVTDEALAPVALNLDLFNPSVLQWSPDGARLAIQAYECPSCDPDEPVFGDVPTSIYLVDVDGGNLIRLTEPNYDTMTGWSADGLEISFVRTDLSGESPVRAFTVPTSGGAPTEILEGLTYGPSWSPDGSTLAYGGNDGVVVSPADASGEPITIPSPDGTLVNELHWSPSGRYLLYGTSGQDGTSTLWIVRADGAEPSRAISPDDGLAILGAWQPILSELP